MTTRTSENDPGVTGSGGAPMIEIAPDPVLDGVRGLFAGAGVTAVRDFLGSSSWDLQALRPVQALYHPGSSCAVRFRARALSAAGEPRVLSITAETRVTPRKVLAPGPEFEERYGLAEPVAEMGPYLVWAFPYDPALKGLEEAAWGPAMRERLGGADERPRAVHARPLRYRPRRRAVFRYQNIYGGSTASRIVYGKVLRTKRARESAELTEALSARAGILRRRRSLPAHLALPARIDENILLFKPMPGRSLRDLLLSNDPLPEPRQVVELMRSMADLAPLVGHIASARHSRSADTITTSTVGLLGHLMPDLKPDLERLAADITAAADTDAVPPAVVHGDLYDAQVLVQDDGSFRLVDVDDLGFGDPALDAANFTTHLLALALARPAFKKRLVDYRSLVREAFLEHLSLHPADLGWREAMVMLQLATGPFRVLDPNWSERVARHFRVARRLLPAGSERTGP